MYYETRYALGKLKLKLKEIILWKLYLSGYIKTQTLNN